MPALLKPFQFMRDARRILRMKDALPSAKAIYHGWLALRRYPNSYREQPLEIELGEYVLHGNNWEELSFLFDEVFVGNEYLSHLTRDDPYIVDCGANIGLASIYFKLHYPGARILAFEPNPYCCEVFKQNMQENEFEDVTLVQAGCSDQAGKTNFHIVPGFSPMSSLQQSRSKEDSETCEVELVRLSEHIDRPVDLLKMDVEGAEWEILDDLIESGRIDLVDRMFIEYHHRAGGAKPMFGDFLNKLEKAGFTYSVAASIPSRRRFSGVFQDLMLYAVKEGKEDPVV